MTGDQHCVWGVAAQEPQWNPEELACLVLKFGGSDIEFDGCRLWANMNSEQFSACMDEFWDQGMAA